MVDSACDVTMYCVFNISVCRCVSLFAIHYSFNFQYTSTLIHTWLLYSRMKTRNYTESFRSHLCPESNGKQVSSVLMLFVCFYCGFFPPCLLSPSGVSELCFRSAPPLKRNLCVILGVSRNGAFREAGCGNSTWYDLHFGEWYRDNGNSRR